MFKQVYNGIAKVFTGPTVQRQMKESTRNSTDPHSVILCVGIGRWSIIPYNTNSSKSIYLVFTCFRFESCQRERNNDLEMN